MKMSGFSFAIRGSCPGAVRGPCRTGGHGAGGPLLWVLVPADPGPADSWCWWSEARLSRSCSGGSPRGSRGGRAAGREGQAALACGLVSGAALDRLSVTCVSKPSEADAELCCRIGRGDGDRSAAGPGYGCGFTSTRSAVSRVTQQTGILWP